MVRSLALEYASAGIRVNGVVPGVTDTPLLTVAVPAEQRERASGSHPRARPGAGAAGQARDSRRSSKRGPVAVVRGSVVCDGIAPRRRRRSPRQGCEQLLMSPRAKQRREGSIQVDLGESSPMARASRLCVRSRALLPRDAGVSRRPTVSIVSRRLRARRRQLWPSATSQEPHRISPSIWSPCSLRRWVADGHRRTRHFQRPPSRVPPRPPAAAELRAWLAPSVDGCVESEVYAPAFAALSLCRRLAVILD